MEEDGKVMEEKQVGRGCGKIIQRSDQDKKDS